MNGKVCRRLRKIAKTKAHSWKEPTTKGAKATKIPEIRLGFVSANAINVENGIFFQRKLDAMSIGAIVKKMKRLFKTNSHRDKNDILSVFEYMIHQMPDVFGMPKPV